MHSAFADGELEAMFTRLGATHRALSSDPWIVSIDDFLSEDEADEIGLLAAAHDDAFEASRDDRYEASHRTSTTLHCNSHPRCAGSEAVRRMEAKAANMLGLPLEHAEPLQIVRYGPGTFYRTHHDQNALRDEPWGVRGLTLFVYLTDAAEGGGGETTFPLLNLSVAPRKGAALLWPNVLLHAPDSESDRRTFHAGSSVASGHKLGANLWWHPFPHRPFFEAGCGAFGHAQYVHPRQNRTRWSAAEHILVWGGTFGGYGELPRG